MRKLGIGCGIVVMVWWALVVGHACWAYQESRLYQGLTLNPCGYDAPFYPNRMIFDSPRNVPFVTTDSTAQITEFYYQSNPQHFQHPLKPYLRRLIMVEFLFHRFEPSCAKWNVVVTVYDYGVFRIATLHYAAFIRYPINAIVSQRCPRYYQVYESALARTKPERLYIDSRC